MIGRLAKACGDEHRAEFIAVQPGRVRLTVQARAADMGCRRVIEKFFFDGVAVEPGDGAKACG
ncbi:MAG TPA: hypothetical protein VLW50_33320 [Streptosporangiaceae bacterium]|nr:hypothetical protein [Streptosporangiaceae bacterium]